MKTSTPSSRIVYFLALLFAISIHPLFSQKPEAIDAFTKSMETTVLNQNGKQYDLREVTPFLNDSEYFSMKDGKLVLPFQGKILRTIPDWVNSGGVNFDKVLGSKVENIPTLEFIMNTASNTFDVPREKIELVFIWFVADKTKTMLYEDVLIVSAEDETIQSRVVKFKDSRMEIVTESPMGGVKNYYKKYEWQSKIKAIGDQD